jgi:CRISPR-associated protein Csx17
MPTKPTKSKAQLKTESWLGAALAGADDVELPRVSSAGTWFVFANKSFNTGQKWSREGQLSPWSYLLAVEGAFLLVGDVNRRLGAKARPYAVFPFVCDPAQPTTAGEVGMLRGEFWAPLWDNPATLAEVRRLLRRGLARVGGRSAHAPAEFAVAALGAGTDAGVAEFARFELRHTTTTDYCREAIPREHVTVGREPAAGRLLTEIVNWVGALRRHDDNRERQFRGLCGPVEASVIRVSEAVGRPEEPERWRQLLLELARQQTRIDRNKTFRESLPPLPRLGTGWFDRAWPEGSFPDEIAVARSVASVGAGTPLPVIVNVFGVEIEARKTPVFAPGERPARVVWDDGQPLRVFGQILRRRLIDAERDQRLPVGGTQPAPLDVVNRLLVGELDLDLIASWVPALSLIDWTVVRLGSSSGGVRFAGDLLLWGLFRPIFHENPNRLAEWLPQETRPAFARRILNLILAGNIDEAVRTANSYYRASGRKVVDVPVAFPGGDLPTRLAAALLIPAADRDIRDGLKRWLFPVKLTIT